MWFHPTMTDESRRIVPDVHPARRIFEDRASLNQAKEFGNTIEVSQTSPAH